MVYKFTAEVLNRIRSKLEKSIKDQIEKPMGSPPIKLDASGNLKIDGSQVDFTNLPTSDPGVAGRLWNDSNTLKISAG